MYAIISDIHGNLSALGKIDEDLRNYDIEGIILLGDLIDYGMQSNETVGFVRNNWSDKIICNIWGNHERAILTPDYDHFSSSRGVECARYTASVLSPETVSYLNGELDHSGTNELIIDGRKILAVHGSLEDPYWKSVCPDNVRGDYSPYDIVLSGHSHYSHCFTKFYDVDDPVMRNKKAVTFINPGSVGQPRNHNPKAQYALLDVSSMNVIMRAVSYNIDAAMALYNGQVDEFYKTRLKNGV
ncbi:MAG: metallophosphoesterase family protein [Clostridiales bacterium]|nr:metallophosphoesterase family protein [Clostridiales bacterium]